VLLDVFDMQGRNVYSRSFEQIHTGRNVLTLHKDDAGLRAGLYLLAFKQGQKFYSAKVRIE
jgi:hypothetical protein